jgi:hypothetical protein
MVLVVAVVRGLLCGEGIEDEDDSGKMRKYLTVLVVVVVRGLQVKEESRMKDDDEDEDDSGKMRELLARARGRRRPRSGGGEGIEDEGRRRGRLRGMTREF